MKKQFIKNLNSQNFFNLHVCTLTFVKVIFDVDIHVYSKQVIWNSALQNLFELWCYILYKKKRENKIKTKYKVLEMNKQAVICQNKKFQAMNEYQEALSRNWSRHNCHGN